MIELSYHACMISVKRIYKDKDKTDGTRVLIDRLWPRGVKKEDAEIDQWRKDLAPSKELFQWFHEDKEGRFEEFQKYYRRELGENAQPGKDLLQAKTLTLITAVKDIDHSHVPMLKKFLEEQK